MSRARRYALRFFVVIVAVGLVAALVGSPKIAPGPYASALSNLAVSQTYAASTCNNKACAGGSRHNIVCAKVTTPGTDCFNYQGFCINQNCT